MSIPLDKLYTLTCHVKCSSLGPAPSLSLLSTPSTLLQVRSESSSTTIHPLAVVYSLDLCLYFPQTPSFFSLSLAGSEANRVVVNNYHVSMNQKSKSKPHPSSLSPTSPQPTAIPFSPSASTPFSFPARLIASILLLMQLTIKCYRIRSKYGDKVGSCFPELEAEINQSH